MQWDCTRDVRNSKGQRYTHEVKDGVVAYRCYAPGESLRNVAGLFIEGYDHGEDDTILVVATVTNLYSQRTQTFAFSRDFFEFPTTQAYVSF